MEKLRVGVLMGGKSIEREVSFNSGRTICDHLDTSRYDIIPIFQSGNGSLYLLPWKFLYRGKIADFEHRLIEEAKKITWDDLKKLIDFMYIALHGSFAEDGTIQGFLEILQIPYVGSKVFGSALSMNKIIQKKFLKHHGIAVPEGFYISAYQLATLTLETLEPLFYCAHLTFPCIVKPAFEGSSLGISIAYTMPSLLEAIITAAHIDENRIQDVLIEQRINGMEFSCIILGNQMHNDVLLLPPTEIIPDTDFFDYEQKYMPGKATKFTPARASAELIQKIQQTCLSVMRILELTMARIDGFVTDNNTIVIIDPNSLSGMSPASFLFRQAAELNMNHTQIINYLIENELKYVDKKMMIQTKPDLSTHNKIRVGVFLGGRSNEKEISLESGRNILYKLSPEKYDAFPIFVSSKLTLHHIDQKMLVRNSTKEIEVDLEKAQSINWDELPHLIDFAFIGLHGGEGENGSIQGTFELLGIPYNGSSVLTSALCMNKYKTNELLKTEGFDVPSSLLITAQEWFSSKDTQLTVIQQQFSFPCIIKPHDDGCSVLVSKAYTIQELEQFVDTVFATGQKNTLLIEEFIKGTELTVGVLGNHTLQVLPPSQVVAQHDILSIEEKFLPGAGENQTPAHLPSEAISFIQETIGNVYKTVNAKGYARIDCFYQNALQSPTGIQRLIILEINTLPGLTPATCIFHQAAEIGMKPMDFIDTIITLGFEEYHFKNAGVGTKAKEKTY